MVQNRKHEKQVLVYHGDRRESSDCGLSCMGSSIQAMLSNHKVCILRTLYSLYLGVLG